MQIRSFSSQGTASGVHCDVYVTPTFPFAKGDSRLLCKSNIWPDGVFNCNFSLIGNYLVFMPVDGAEAGLFESLEIRAWSAKDVAPAATSTVSGLTGPTLPKGTHLFSVTG